MSRVILSEENGKLLQQWIDQLQESCPGIRVRKQDLVNWVVSEKTARLTSNDLKAIKERYFDDIELAEWALRQLKAAKAKNEKVALADLLKGTNPSPAIRKARSTKNRSAMEVPQIEQAKDGGLGLEPIATLGREIV